MGQQIWRNQQGPQDWKRSVFIPIQKKDDAKEGTNYFTITLISHPSKVMLKILPTRLQQYMNRELTDVQAEFRKGRGTRNQIANIYWIIEKAREFQQNIYFCFIDYIKDSYYVDHKAFWKVLQQMGIPGHLSCLLRNVYAGQKQQLELNMEKETDSKSGKKDINALLIYLICRVHHGKCWAG